MKKVRDEKTLRMYGFLVDDLERYFPHIHEKMVRWYPSGPMQIIVITNDGKRYEYNPKTGYVHILPKLDDNSFYESEERWKEEFRYKFRKMLSNTGLTQEQIAELSGVSKTTISEISNSKKSPKLFTVARIAKAIGYDISELMDFHMDDEEE